jgi:transcriptional regulator with XRE-family HTH domain
MTNPNEIPEIKGAEFARARERVGMSTADLAKMASLTTSHVEQIENGESSCFYSPAIKFVAAKKLATFWVYRKPSVLYIQRVRQQRPQNRKL